MNEDDIYRAKVIRYLAKAAEHGYLNYLRKLRASSRIIYLESMPEIFQRTGWEEDPLTQVVHREELAEAYAKLPETYQEVLALLVVYGLTPQETASCLGCTVEHVYQRKSRALKRLREMIGGKN